MNNLKINPGNNRENGPQSAGPISATSPSEVFAPGTTLQGKRTYYRQKATFRSFLEAGKRHPPEKGRYRLYVSEADPWAHRVILVHKLKGLDGVVDLCTLDNILSSDGLWQFKDSTQQQVSYNLKTLKDLYNKSTPNYIGRFTVPVLWDSKTETIVNNDSGDIMKILNESFNEFATCPQRDFYPETQREQIDATNSWINSAINNGVYKTGFSTTQSIYKDNAAILFKALDRIESKLSDGREWVLTGKDMTETDIHLFTTVVRFDPVYYIHFKCNLKSIENGYPNILKWCKRVYNSPGVKETVDIQSIKAHYYTSHSQLNPLKIISQANGPDLNT